MAFVKIAGTGSYLPEQVLTNADLSAGLDTTDEWIVQRVGIKQRHLLRQDETLKDMMLPAAKAAMRAAKVMASDIDLIIVATVTADKVFPSAACELQSALGVNNETPAFDLNAACAGFIYAFNVALKFMQSETVQNILVVGADALSKIIDWENRSTCILFGDGAGAVVLQRAMKSHILATQLHADGQYADLLSVRNSAWHGFCPQYVEMQGKEVFRLATTKLGDLVTQLVKKAGLSLSDIDWLIPHQANKRIIDAIAKKLNLGQDKIIQTIEHHGNTSSASVPLALDYAVSSGKIQRGDILMLEAFGGGFAWGGVLLEY